MEPTDDAQANPERTAGAAGWRLSRYNLYADVPDTQMTAVVNLFKGVCAEFNPIEMDLLSIVEDLEESHPFIERFARRGVIVDFDERAALEAMGRAACANSHDIGLSICPTMGCNFDCPYCFEDHAAGKMTPEVQDDVVALAERMMDAVTSAWRKPCGVWGLTRMAGCINAAEPSTSRVTASASRTTGIRPTRLQPRSTPTI